MYGKVILVFLLKIFIAMAICFIAQNVSDTFLSGAISGILYVVISEIIDIEMR